MSMSLAEQDDYLYMNSENNVYVFDTHTGELGGFAVNDSGSSFYGLRIIDGKVYAVLAEEPQVGGELYYVGDCLVREEQPAVIIGDVDGDGTVTVNDVTALQMYLAECFEPTPEQLAAADVNRDGKVNIRDVTQLQRFLAEFVSL